MPRIEITSIDDPRLEPYREIRSKNWTVQSGIFIAEGQSLVRELLASDFGCQSLLIDRKYQHQFTDLLDTPTDVLVVDHACIAEIVGFKFHRGILGCGRRKPALNIRSDWKDLVQGETIVALLGIQDPENIGGILRTCAGLGVQRVILGPGCADPFSRRALRVSMGNALKLEIFPSRNLVDDIAFLRQRDQVASYAATPQLQAAEIERGTLPLEQIQRSGPAMILLGNERDGLPPPVLQSCDHLVRIDMENGVDSLNVGVAAGILLHYFCRTSIHSD
ncbi:MAG: RNA methyltransferase [bacterium]|nr:RNA methyltransferase [bacterium]